jgi:hypothetical protein
MVHFPAMTRLQVIELTPFTWRPVMSRIRNRTPFRPAPALLALTVVALALLAPPDAAAVIGGDPGDLVYSDDDHRTLASARPEV